MRCSDRLTLAVLPLLVACASPSAFDLGAEAYDRGDMQAALVNWMPAAQAGDPRAMHSIGLVMEHGLGANSDRREAVRVYTMAARMGYQASRVRLAQLGEPVPPMDLVPMQQPAQARSVGALEALGRGFGAAGSVLTGPPAAMRCETRPAYPAGSDTLCR